MTSRVDMVPVPLLHNLKHNKVLHQRVVLLHVATENIPRVARERRLSDVRYLRSCTGMPCRQRNSFVFRRTESSSWGRKSRFSRSGG
jgi:hypothetical protein